MIVDGVHHEYGKINAIFYSSSNIHGNEKIKNTLFLVDNKIYVCGRNNSCMLGLGHDGIINNPTFLRRDVIQLSVGACHACFIDKNNNLYGMGDNLFGQIAQESRVLHTKIPRIFDKNILQVTCGLYFTAAIDIEHNLYIYYSKFEEINFGKRHSIPNKRFKTINAHRGYLYAIDESQNLYKISHTSITMEFIKDQVYSLVCHDVTAYFLADETKTLYSYKNSLIHIAHNVSGIKFTIDGCAYIQNRICYICKWDDFEFSKKRLSGNAVLIKWTSDHHDLVLREPHNRIITFLLISKRNLRYFPRLVRYIIINYICF